jgi:hypothetical protein
MLVMLLEELEDAYSLQWGQRVFRWDKQGMRYRVPLDPQSLSSHWQTRQQQAHARCPLPGSSLSAAPRWPSSHARGPKLKVRDPL